MNPSDPERGAADAPRAALGAEGDPRAALAAEGDQRAALGAALRSRIPAILDAWKQAIAADAQLATHRSLPRAQLEDHLPRWLDTLARAIAAAPGAAEKVRAEDEEAQNAEAHGRERWQLGYDLHELIREWGALLRCVMAEIDRYAAAAPAGAAAVMAHGRDTLVVLMGESMSRSTGQYFRLSRMEARGNVRDLEDALGGLRELEQSRGVLWRQAAHDLRGNLGNVANVAAIGSGGGFDAMSPERRAVFFSLLDRNIASLHALLDDVTDLARLQAGAEQRRVDRFDAAGLLGSMCEDMRPLAEAKRLTLHSDGATPLVVEGDAVKVRRIAQNLVQNAIRYTGSGSVAVAWGLDGEAGDDGSPRWWFSVADTGPGMRDPDGGPRAGEEGATTEAVPMQGEGIGLAIVKRLTQLLEGELEIDSRPQAGTRLTVSLPGRYPG